MANILGYTQSGKPVYEPTRGAPNTNDVVVFQRTKAKYPGWTKADHMDAEWLMVNAVETDMDPKIRALCRRWIGVHWDIGGRWTSPQFDAYIAGR